MRVLSRALAILALAAVTGPAATHTALLPAAPGMAPDPPPAQPFVRCETGYRADQPRNGHRILIRAGALTVTPARPGDAHAVGCALEPDRHAAPNWHWGMRLLSYGAEKHAQALAATEPQVGANRLLLDHGPLIEWYENRPGALKQGFTLLRPPRPGARHLVLRLALLGNLNAVWEVPGQALAFHQRSGDYALSYRGLTVLDAVGRRLPARMALVSGGLEIRIDAAGASWPLEVDPVIFNEQRISSLGGSGGDFFGWSLALSGDTALVGAWLDDERGRDAGAAYVFVRERGSWRLQAKLTAADTAAGDFFGAAVALDGDRALIGAPMAGDDDYFAGDAGVAYLFERDGDHWHQRQRLNAADAASGDLFGRAVALAGDTAVVGAYGDRDNGMNSGAVYVFERADGDWVEAVKLKADDGRTDDRFGASLALDGDRILVGAYRDDDHGIDSGAAYLFRRSDNGWAQTAKLTPSDGRDLGFFGFSVALSGDTALIGAWRDDAEVPDGGGAYLFQRVGDRWRQRQKIAGTNDGARFGYAVALEGSTALIGAYLDDTQAGAAGAVYLYARAGERWRRRATLTGEARDQGFGIALALSGGTALIAAVLEGTALKPGAVHVYDAGDDGWRPQAVLAAPVESLGDRFGAAVALSTELALIGAPKADTEHAELTGAAFLFQREPRSLGAHQVLIARDGAIGDGFGRSVAVANGRALVGAPGADAGETENGLVYVFAQDDAGWREEARLRAGDGDVRSGFGEVLAIDGDRALVGAPGDSEAAPNAGAVYLFERSSSGWARRTKLMPADAAADMRFGSALALAGERALIGAFRDSAHGRLAGSAYLFERMDSGWVQRQKLVAADTTDQHYFGYSVALDDAVALIGAWGDAEQGHQAGAVYLFEPGDAGWEQRAKLTPAPAGSRLGVSLALSGPLALAGAYADGDARSPIGAGYVLAATDQGWVAEAKLTTAAANPSYGMAVALDGDGALIATALADESGAVSFFRVAIDRDADSVPDAGDNCPELENIDQLDADGDGVGDACSAPSTPAKVGDSAAD